MEYDDLDDAALAEESQTMDEAVINILDDPMALSMALRNQYDLVQKKNQLLRQQEKEELQGNDDGDVQMPQQSIQTVLESQEGYTLEQDETTEESR